VKIYKSLDVYGGAGRTIRDLPTRPYESNADEPKEAGIGGIVYAIPNIVLPANTVYVPLPTFVIVNVCTSTSAPLIAAVAGLILLG
jgi:hypothetical protein